LTLTFGRQSRCSALVNVVVQASLGFRCVCHYLHPHLFLAALPRSPFQFLLLAQNDLWRGPDFVGAFRLLPVALFVFALPLAVNPPPALTDSFSPLPTDRLGDFFLGITHSSQNVDSQPG